MHLNSSDLLKKIIQLLYNKKALHIIALDVREISNFTDYFIVAEGQASTHVQALADCIFKELKEIHILPMHIEGKSEGEWTVLDYETIIIHLFKPNIREYYRLEEMWKDGKIVDLNRIKNQLT